MQGARRSSNGNWQPPTNPGARLSNPMTTSTASLNEGAVADGGDAPLQQTRRSKNIMPVTCKQLLECTGDNFVLEGCEANTVTILGKVQTVEWSPTKVSIWIDDQTATIECVNYISVEDAASPDLAWLRGKNPYGRIVGAIRTNNIGRKFINVYKATPIDDLNELTYHLMDTVQNGLKLRKFRTDKEKGDSRDPKQMILKFFADRRDPTSVETQSFHKDEVFAGVSNYMSKAEVNETLDLLSNEGLVYITLDDDYYALTDI